MSIEVIKVERSHASAGYPMVSINAKSKRMFLNVEAYTMLKQLYGQKETDYVLLHKDTTNPDALYIKPCDSHIPFRRKISKTKSTRFLEINAILKSLQWNIPKTTRFKVSLDKKNEMLRIDRKERDPENVKVIKPVKKGK
jgi:hypothetical protein